MTRSLDGPDARLAPPRRTRTARVLLYGDGSWAAATLVRLLAEGHEVPAVVLRARPSDGTLAEAAHAAGVPVLQFGRANGADALDAVRALAPEVILSVAFNEILRAPLLELARVGCINVHAGKLPEYRGRNVINWALINGETEIGVTAHLMDEGIDTGDLLLQQLVPVGWTDGYGDVLARVVEAVPRVAAEAVAGLASGHLRPQPQLDAWATYFGGRGPDDEWLDWSASSRALHNKIRAITRPAPGARTLLGRAPVVIWRALWEPGWPVYTATPGQVVGYREGGTLVKTGDSTLLVLEAELPDDPPAAPHWPIGTRLGPPALPTLMSLLDRVERLEARLA